MNESDTKPLFAPRDEPTSLDALLLFILPALILVLIYLYPGSEQILEYKARSPSTLTILGSNLAHRSLGHLAGNIIGYLLIGGLIFMYCSAARWKRLYYYVFGAYLLILPFFASSYAISMLEDYNLVSQYESVGFSLTVAALIAFLPIALDLFFQDNISDAPPTLFASAGLYLSGYSVVFLNLGAASPLVLIATVAFAVFTVSALLWYANKALDDPIHRSTSVKYLTFGLFVFYVGLFSLFPTNVGSSFVGHMAGYTGGYLLPVSGLSLYYLDKYFSSKMNGIYEWVRSLQESRDE